MRSPRVGQLRSLPPDVGPFDPSTSNKGAAVRTVVTPFPTNG